MCVHQIYVDFGLAVRAQRTQRNQSQRELGDSCGLGRATIASIEAGRQAVALHQAIQISQALGCDLGHLLECSQEESTLRELLDDPGDLEIVRQLLKTAPP